MSEGFAEKHIGTGEVKKNLAEVDRTSPQWVKFRNEHLKQLQKTYNGLSPDGDPITKEELFYVAEKYADSDMRSFMKLKDKMDSLKGRDN